jgi:hypothetical protein
MNGEMDGATRYLSKSKFAAEQGWVPSYVTKLGQQGRLVLSEDKKFVDVHATLAMLRKTDDPGKESVRQHHQAARVDKHVGDHIKHDSPVDEPSSNGTDPKYWDNKARREGALAELAELELAKKRGGLVETSRVEAMAFAAGRTLRDTVLGLPTQLAPVFASMTDSFQIEVKLRDALRQVFADAAKMTADDLTRVSDQSH